MLFLVLGIPFFNDIIQTGRAGLVGTGKEGEGVELVFCASQKKCR